MLPDYSPPSVYYVTVHFKPKDVRVSEAAETRTVEFALHSNLRRDRVYDIAEDQAVEQGVICEYAIQHHWEPYSMGVETPPQSATNMGPHLPPSE